MTTPQQATVKIRILAALEAIGRPVGADYLDRLQITYPAIIRNRLADLLDDNRVDQDTGNLYAITELGRDLLARHRGTLGSELEPITLRELLTAVGDNPPLTFRPLADALGVPPGDARRGALNDLVKKAVADRLIDRELDMRYRLTTLGEQYLEQPAHRPGKRKKASINDLLLALDTCDQANCDNLAMLIGRLHDLDDQAARGQAIDLITAALLDGLIAETSTDTDAPEYQLTAKGQQRADNLPAQSLPPPTHHPAPAAIRLDTMPDAASRRALQQIVDLADKALDTRHTTTLRNIVANIRNTAHELIDNSTHQARPQ